MQTRSQVLKLGEGQNTLLGGQDFCFHCMFTTNLSTTKFWGHKIGENKKFGGYYTRGYGPG